MRIHQLFALLIFVAFSGSAQETKPLRIVALAPHVVENLYAIGAGDLIIATSAHADHPKSAQALPRVGNYAQLQVEKIFALQPDYVIVWRNGNPAADLVKLEQLGLRVIDSTPHQLADVGEELRKLGLLLNKQEQAERVANTFEQGLNKLKQIYSQREKLQVFYEFWPKPLSTVANNSWAQQILEVCGAHNLFSHLKGDYPMVSLESVLAAKPKVIIQPKDSARTIPANDWSRWSQLPAVQEHAFIYPNADKLHRMTPRMLDEAKLLCQQLDLLR